MASSGSTFSWTSNASTDTVGTGGTGALSNVADTVAVAPAKPAYKPSSKCESCLGTGDFTDGGEKPPVEVCVSGPCNKCPCGGSFCMEADRWTKICNKCKLTFTAPGGAAVKAAMEKMKNDPAMKVVPVEGCQYCDGTGLYGISEYFVDNFGTCAATQVCKEGKCRACPCGYHFSLDPKNKWRKYCSRCNREMVVDPNMASLSKFVPKSQKAKGLRALKLQSAFVTEKFKLLLSDEDVEKFEPGGKFIRPCPTKPRHGFVESRVCKTKEELLGVWKEARTADPNAELIAMDLIKAKASAIYVPESGALAVGPGTDGATGGKKSIMIPVIPMKAKGQTGRLPLAKLRQEAEIEKGSHTYLELIYKKGVTKGKNATVVVQARSGPPVSGGAEDYIPKKTKVVKVLTPDDDLLKWEKICEENKGKAGIVAWKKGATLASHAAVHCVAAGIPFLTKETKPKKGEILMPTATAADFDQQESAIGFHIAWITPVDQIGNGVRTAVAILHNSPALRGSKQWSRLYGYMTGMIFRAGALACVGEARHRKDISNVKNETRKGAWKTYTKFAPRWLAQKVARLIPVFLSNKWDGSYGGPPWAKCCEATVKLYLAMSNNEPDKALACINEVINVCHNGGKLLTKFVGADLFDNAANYPALTLAQNVGTLLPILAKKKIKKPTPAAKFVKRGHLLKVEPFRDEDCDSKHVKLKFLMPSGKKTGKIEISTDPIVWKSGNKAHDLVKTYVEEF